MTKSVKIQKIGIVGAGQMGNGIAQVCAQCGYSVTLADISGAVLEKAIKGLHGRLQRLVEKERLT